MLQQFQNHINTNLNFLYKQKLLVAVSGGIDSMVLLDLCQKLNFDLAVIHCNFNLRGAESDLETQFIQDFCFKNNIDCIVNYFDTKKYAQQNKLSIQVAARELRYSWFKEQVEKLKFNYLLTAHHADDNLETFFINLCRGTGVEGLTGIPRQNNYVVRPLLPFSRKEIEDYALANSLKWCEDSSNAEDKYLRNKIRNTLVPVLKDINPMFLSTLQTTIQNVQQAETLMRDALNIASKKIVTQEENQLKIDIDKLKKLPNYNAYLYQWLKEYEFTAWQDIYNLVDAQTGKQVFANNYVILKDRDFLIVYNKDNLQNNIFYIDENQFDVKVPIKLSLCNASNILFESSNTIFVDAQKLHFPLMIRRWQQGDVIYPLGMKGKKKLSKYFKDEKYSLVQKQNQWLLCSQNKIIWVIGKRADDRFKVTKQTNHILQITLQQ